ncbi:MAG: nucleoside recognition protein, partial [Lachnospiraceae bacterium]|nr:nucleoside recognition protein [Lachnospiraceae bacterium]
MNKFPLRSILLFLLLIPMLYFSEEVTEGARTGLLLWYHSVVPALFPFMVISGLIISGGGIMHIMHPFYKILHPILGLSHEGCYVLISGLLCGYPMGAKTCAEFAADKRISFNEAKFLMTICNHPSPMFILGYVYPLFSEHITIVELLLTI